MIKNTASQSVGAQMVSASDGSAFTGSVTAYVTGDNGTQAQGSVGSGACTHEGNGYHSYAPAQAETNYDHVAFTFIGTGAVPQTVEVWTTIARQTGDSFARLGAPADTNIATDIANVATTLSGVAAAAATAVWAAGTRTLTSFGSLVSDIWAAVVDSAGVTTLLSRLSATRAGYLDNLSAGAVATQASVDDVQSDIDTIASTIADIDSDAAAIKTQTDLLAFNAANRLLVDVRYINDVLLQGAGVTGNSWRPA